LFLPKKTTSCYLLPYIVLNYTLESYGYAEICFYGDQLPNTYFKVKALFFSFNIQIASLILQGNMHRSVVPIIFSRLLAIN